MENNEEMSFFEGTEKLLEIWFARADGKHSLKNDLRDIPRECIDNILDMVNCKILSCTRTRDLDSYVLSESSLFVNKSRLLIKTCGTTTLLESVKPFVDAAFVFAGFDTVRDVFYSRRRFMRPDLQKAPHHSFEHEVSVLDELLGVSGNAYAFGKLNGDCWYLYTLNKPVSVQEPDQTLEIIMTKLDADVMSIFTKEVSASTEEATRKSRIDTIFPNAVLDGFLFDPCGYSVNALLPKGHYFTIHITPEASCSYVSFETNAPSSDYHELIARVLDIFKPGQFIVTLCANESSLKQLVGSISSDSRQFGKKHCQFDEYDYDLYQETRVKNYDVVYAHYTKRPI